MNKRVSVLFVIVTFTILICSCTRGVWGDPNPKGLGSEYLKSTGVQDETIDRIANRKEMSRDEFEKYSRSDDVNVRHLIASNTHIPSDLLSVLVKDKHFFVREGAAYNTSINKDMIDMLKNDTNLSVLSLLVTNPSVPEDDIIRIYNTNKKYYLSWCAMNAKCPGTIHDDILKSDDEMARSWLRITEDRAKKNENNPAK